MLRHGDSILALIKKRNRFIELKSKTEQLKRQISSLEKNLRIITPEPTISSIPTKLELTNTTSVLELVFANLDYKDITKPVCKLWTQLAGCNSLWKSLYRYHFGTTLSLLPHTNLHWRKRFRTALLARNSIRGMKDNFGWSIRVCPVVDCNKALWSKFEFDAHLLKHIDQELTKRAIIMRRDQKRNAKRKAHST